jgi:hypothetical protein
MLTPSNIAREMGDIFLRGVMPGKQMIACAH